MGRFGEALSAYDAAIEAHPEDVFAKSGRAETLRSMGRFAEALSAYDATIEAHPENVVAKSGRAETLRSMGRFAEALSAYDASIEAHPENVIAKNGRASLLVNQNRLEDALSAVEVMQASGNADWITLHVKGMVFLKMGRLPEAVEVLERGVRECPLYKSRQYFASALAIVQMRRHDLPAAGKALEVASQGPEAPPVALIRMHYLGLVGDYGQVEEVDGRLCGYLPPEATDVREELRRAFILMLPRLHYRRLAVRSRGRLPARRRIAPGAGLLLRRCQLRRQLQLTVVADHGDGDLVAGMLALDRFEEVVVRLHRLAVDRHGHAVRGGRRGRQGHKDGRPQAAGTTQRARQTCAIHRQTLSSTRGGKVKRLLGARP